MEKKTTYKLFAISTVMLVLCIDIPVDACLGLTASDETSLSDMES